MTTHPESPLSGVTPVREHAPRWFLITMILAALAMARVPVQTIAPKFTGRFNKGVDYVGDVARFDKEFREDLAVIAYAMDPLELDGVIRQAEANGERLKAFYHSHPNHEAYFSDEDKVFACPFGEPTFPDTVQIVVSIYERTVKTAKAFVWSDEKSDFVEVSLHHI